MLWNLWNEYFCGVVLENYLIFIFENFGIDKYSVSVVLWLRCSFCSCNHNAVINDYVIFVGILGFNRCMLMLRLFSSMVKKSTIFIETFFFLNAMWGYWQLFIPFLRSLVCSDYLFKLLLIGDSGVGKSCLLLRFAVSYFPFSPLRYRKLCFFYISEFWKRLHPCTKNEICEIFVFPIFH